MYNINAIKKLERKLLLDKNIEAQSEIEILYGMKAKIYRHKRVAITYDYSGKTKLI
ncbi:MAG: hypothetical protein ACRCSK_00080 [Fusobacteriaceae bacterium]